MTAAHTLPEAVTSFVGRRAELAATRARMSESRLVTLTGAPGAGKTRLAVHVAAGSGRAFPGGVWMVDLASLDDPGKVAQTVVEALEVPDHSARPPEDKLVDHLRDRLALVLLDNCEHVLDEAARLTARLLRSCPRVHVLATSRESLAIDGEHVYPVPPLSATEATRLLVERARAARPDFAVTDDNREAVEQLCATLDGLPLAIELAATRLRSLDVAEVVKRLDRRFALLVGGRRDWQPRQQTLRALMDWSFELCTSEERTLWARASVFAGSFDLGAAEAVCAGDDLAEEAVADVLDHLVAKSLLAVEEGGRYRMLMTVREYGAELVRAAGEEEHVRRRHREHYLETARAAATAFQQGRTAALAPLRRDHPNLRAALAWSLARPQEARAGAALAGALQYHWFTDAFVSEGLHWLEQALEAAPDPTLERADALWAAALLALVRGQLERTASWLEESSRIGASLADGSLAARDAHGRAYVKLFGGDVAGSLELFETAIAGHRAAGQVAWEVSAQYSAIVAFAYAGEFDRARAISGEAMATCDRHGDRWARGFVQWATGVLEWRQGHLEAARERALAALQGERELKRGLCVAYCLELLSWVAAAEGALEQAARLQGAARAVWSAMGTHVGYGPQVQAESAVALLRATEGLGRSRCDALVAEQAGLSIGQAVAFALGDALQTDGAAPEPSPLTAREREVADLIAAGKSNKAIAEALVLSPRTIEGHVERILAKLGCSSRTQVAAWVLRGHVANG